MLLFLVFSLLWLGGGLEAAPQSHPIEKMVSHHGYQEKFWWICYCESPKFGDCRQSPVNVNIHQLSVLVKVDNHQYRNLVDVDIHQWMVDSPAKCALDSECGDTALLTCDLELKVCKCREKYSVLSTAGTCLPAKQLGEECVESSQCRLLEKNASCEDKSCVCDSGFYLLHDNNGSLCNPDKSAGDVPKAAVDQNMIIVLAVLAVMFVGICVALHLFSKARFRNRRTIFNSPHPRLMHIKLGKRKKSSVRTHHLPPPPNCVTRHHSFSGAPHSPYPMARVPKTRSHECLRSSLSREVSPHFERRPKTAPLAERESLPPSTEHLDKKTPDPVPNGGSAPHLLHEEDESLVPPGSPTVIITDADGAHTVVTATHPSSPSSAVNV